MKRLPPATFNLHLRPLRLLSAAALIALTLWGAAEGKMSVIDTPHNLSASGGRGRTSGLPGVSFSGETQICVFCHVPHNAKSGTPLWSRDFYSPDGLQPPQQYQPYADSSTLNASPKPGLPTGSSRLCLSCHDGTLALSKYTRSRLNETVYMPTDQIAGATAAVNATVNANLGTDLRDDHPISFQYTDALAQKSHLVNPGSLPAQIKLETVAKNLECTACHDPHDNQYGNFLVMNNGSDNPASPNYMTGSPLCVTCHQPEGWSGTTHNNITVPSLGHQCLSCHTVHSAPGAVRLLQNPASHMEDNCLASCHNDSSSTATSKNMKPLFAQGMFHHPVETHNATASLDHDEKESLPVSADAMHVQCVDCHNPHEVNSANAPLANPPNIDGRLNGVRIDSAGTYATTEYDVCFKCHSGPGASKGVGSTDVANRVVSDPDEKNRFNPLNYSYHPVMGSRPSGSTGASLLTDFKASMVRIYCTDCHNSDQSQKAVGAGGGPNGPHGSQYPHIMIARYYMPLASTILTDRFAYTSGLYSLCWRCHSESYVMTSGTAFRTGTTNHHYTHVSDQRIPCYACHDPHGVPKSSALVNSTNSLHLMNFDKSWAGSATLTPSYQSTGTGSGTCTVVCHSPATDPSYGNVAKSLLQLRALQRRRR